MINHIDITGVRYTADDTTKRYVRKKIGGLDRYLSRHTRKSTYITVNLREVNRANGNKYECDVIMKLPEKTITAKDSTMNMLAAVDIVAEKLSVQLKKYHDARKDHKREHNFIGRLKRRIARPSYEM